MVWVRCWHRHPAFSSMAADYIEGGEIAELLRGYAAHPFLVPISCVNSLAR